MAGPTRTFEENQAAAAEHLARFAESTLPHLIGGHAVPSASGTTFENTSPIDGSRLGDVASGDAADIDAAATAAAAAFEEWSATPGTERKRILHDVADLITERAHQIAQRRGDTRGHELEDWRQAERELRVERGLATEPRT